MIKLFFLFMFLFSSVAVAEYQGPYKVTAYPPLRKHTDATPFITAFKQERVKRCGIAVSREIESQNYKHGCYVHIYGVSHCSGIFRVNDRTGWDMEERFDIFFFKLSDAVNFGVGYYRVNLLWCE